jgi:hypothetical protein
MIFVQFLANYQIMATKFLKVYIYIYIYIYFEPLKFIIVNYK